MHVHRMNERLALSIRSVALLGALNAGVLGAATRNVVVEVASGVTWPATVEGEVAARSADGHSEVVRSPFACAFPGPCAVDLDLPDGKLWLVTAEAPGFGSSPPAPVEAGRVEIWLAGKLRGEAVFPKGTTSPDGILVRYRSLDQRSSLGGGAPLEGEAACAITESKFECTMPAGRVDFNVRARGHVSVYAWNRLVPHLGVLSLGRVEFRKGASLVGNVVSKDPLAPKPGACRVSLRPSGDSPKPAPTAPPLPSISVDGRGFFHLEVIPPGRWDVVAEQEGFVPSKVPVTILEGAEARLNLPIVLSRPSRLEVTLSPPQDAYGEAWQVELIELEGEGKSAMVARSVGSPEGTWTRDGLGASARYYLRVLTGKGQRWWFDEQPFSPETTPFRKQVVLESDGMKGALTLGGQPLRGRAVFEADHGNLSVTFEADDGGRFEGFLPRLGKWSVEVFSVSPRVHRKVEVDVRRTQEGIGQVIVSLSDRALRGEIVTEEGALVPKAILRVVPPTASETTSQVVEGGSFHLDGLEPGDYVLSGAGPRLFSDDHRVTLPKEGDADPVRIVLKKSNDLKVQVRSASGGALVGVPVALVASFSGQATTTRRTDGDGRVSFPVRPTTPEECVVIIGPGIGTKIVAVPNLGEETQVTIAATGGALSIDFPEPTEKAYPVLQHGACALSPTLLSMIVRSKDRKSFFGMDPGDYVLCLTGTDFGAGTGPCKQGTLSPYGALNLAVGLSPK